MNVRMPDGTTITNVPEGTTQEDLQGRLDEARRPPDSFLSRVGTGLADPLYGAAQLADKMLVDPVRQMISPGATSMADVMRQREAEYRAPEGVDVGRIVGTMANPINWVAPEAGVAARALAAAGPVGRAAATGAAQSALAPVDPDAGFLAGKAKQAGLGGAIGGAGSAVLSKVLPRALRLQAFKPTDEATQLLDQGIRLTPGQAVGGMLGDWEQKLTSVPLAGSVIEKARRRATEDVQGRAIERAVGINGLGPTTVDEAKTIVDRMYSTTVPHLNPNPEGLFGAAEALNKAMRNPELTPQHARTLEGLFTDRFANYADLDGPGLKALDSDLGHLGRKYSTFTSSPADKALADAIYDVRQGLREGLEQGVPPDVGVDLRKANAAYRNMLPIHDAASARADMLVTPRALEKAIAKQAGRRVTAMPPDPLLDPAVDVLRATVPDSGTAGRAQLATLLGVGSAGLGGLGALPGTAAGLAGGWLAAKAATSRLGVDALTGRTSAQRWLSSQSPKVQRALITALRTAAQQRADSGATADQ